MPDTRAGADLPRRLRNFHKAGRWRRLLIELNSANYISWSSAAVDSHSLCALDGGKEPTPAWWIGAGRRASVIWMIRGDTLPLLPLLIAGRGNDLYGTLSELRSDAITPGSRS